MRLPSAFYFSVLFLLKDPRTRVLKPQQLRIFDKNFRALTERGCTAFRKNREAARTELFDILKQIIFIAKNLLHFGIYPYFLKNKSKKYGQNILLIIVLTIHVVFKHAHKPVRSRLS